MASLLMKDALKDNYDDVVANAIGSNIFDVCVSLGLLLPGKVGKKSGITLFFLYGGWVIYIAYRTVAT